MLAVSLPSQALAQAAQPDPNAPQQVDPNAPPTPGPGDADTTNDQGAIVITGLRGSVTNSINIKRQAQGIVEAVSAEEIGKLPDQSIAESIARLPGLAAQRVNGRAQVISIRGLSPDFTTTLLNGRQQASSGDNRAVEFDQYPSELLSSVVIYKTPDANIAGFGLSGTADLRTVRPLQYGKRAFAVNLRGEALSGHQLNADVDNRGWRGSASYIDQLTPEFGVAFGLAYLNSPSQNKHYKAYSYEMFPNCCGLVGTISPEGAFNDLFLDGQEVFAYSRVNKRLAGIAIAEWEPNDRMHTIVDLYYSRFKQRETMRGAQWYNNVWTYEQTFTGVQTEDRGGTPLAVSGTVNGVYPQLRNDYNTRDDHLFSAGINNEYKITDDLSLLSDLSYSRNKRNESITELYEGYGCCGTSASPVYTPDSISWDITGNGFPQYSEGLNYGDASQVSLGDRAPWGGWGHDGATKSPHVKEAVKSVDEGLRYAPSGGGFFEQFDLGVNYTHRHKDKTVDEVFDNLKNGRAEVLAGSDILVDPTSLSYAGFGDVLAINVPDALANYYDFEPTLDSAHYDKAWDIKEGVLTWKARAQFASGNLHGNLGLQIVRQKQTSSGQRINFLETPASISAVTQGATYTDVLPSLNAYYDLGGGHRIRFAAAKVLARPRMDDLRANLTPGFNDSICGGSPPCVPGQEVHPWSAEGGNPLLEPWRAKALDLSYEYYMGKASYFAIAVFYKKLDNYIYTRVQPFDFSAFPLPATAANVPAGVIISPIGTVTQPANGPGGNIKGIEISGAFEFSRLSHILDGLGVIGSISKSKSNLNPTDNAGEEIRIPGLSGTVANITGYYEKNGFQARISYRYRSPFKGEVVQLFANRGFTDILADKQVDAQIGYTFPDTSRFAHIGVLLQVSNLTDAPYRTRIGLDNTGPTTANGQTFIETYEKYGRDYLFGVNYNF